MGTYQGGGRAAASGWARGWRPRGVYSEPATGERALLTWADFTWLGAYANPTTPGTDNGYPSGLTHRYVGSEPYPRLYLNYHVGNHLFEVRLNGEPSKTSPANVTTLGDLGRLSDGWLPPTSYPGYSEFRTWGLHWDETDQRLYWGQWKRYDGGDTPDCGMATLTDTTPSVVTTHGVWTLSRSTPNGLYGNQWHYGMTAIPVWFAQAYLGGQRLAVGFGGGRSMIASGPKHIGLALFAMNPIDLTRDQQTPYYQGYLYQGGLTPLSGHPYGGGVSTFGLRGTLCGDWYENVAGYRWTGNDQVGSAVWIDTGTKHGFVHTLAACEAVFAPTARTTVAVAAPAGATTLTLTDSPADLRAGDILWVQSQRRRTGGNGVFDLPTWTAPPGEPAYTNDGLGPHGEAVRVTSVSGAVVNVVTTNTYVDGGGLIGAVSAGAAVIMGVAYYDAIVPTSRRRPQWYCYDPLRFAEVAQGTRTWTDVPYAWVQDQPFPDQPVTGMGGNWEECFGQAVDYSFDARTNRLYVLKQWGIFASATWGTCLHVYQVT